LKFYKVPVCEYYSCEPETFVHRLWPFSFYVSIYLTSLYFTVFLAEKTKSSRIWPAIGYYVVMLLYEIYLLISGDEPNQSSHLLFFLLVLIVGGLFVVDWLGISLNRNMLLSIGRLLRKKARYLTYKKYDKDG